MRIHKFCGGPSARARKRKKTDNPPGKKGGNYGSGSDGIGDSLGKMSQIKKYQKVDNLSKRQRGSRRGGKNGGCGHGVNRTRDFIRDISLRKHTPEGVGRVVGESQTGRENAR